MLSCNKKKVNTWTEELSISELLTGESSGSRHVDLTQSFNPQESWEDEDEEEEKKDEEKVAKQPQPPKLKPKKSLQAKLDEKEVSKLSTMTFSAMQNA